MTLLQLQRQMRSWLHGDESAAPSLGSSSNAGLGVYLNNYRAQLVACLKETYARVHRLLGEDAFLAAAIRHIDTHAPNDWTLERYGGDFGDTLSSTYPLDPHITELAWLDRALSEAFVGPDSAPVEPHALRGIDWDRAIFRFAPTLQVGQATTNSTAIWSALSAGRTPPDVRRLPRAGILVWRKAFTSCFRAIDASEADAIAHLRAGGTFGALCTTLVTDRGDAEGQRIAGELLAQWLRDEMILEVS